MVEITINGCLLGVYAEEQADIVLVATNGFLMGIYTQEQFITILSAIEQINALMVTILLDYDGVDTLKHLTSYN